MWVDDVMREVPRERFLPHDVVGQADIDAPVSIGHGMTNSQPRTVADMLKLLDPQPGDRVLDVGSGSGWTTALLAYRVGPEGSVIGVEIVPELVQMGRENVTEANARIEQAGDELGWPEEAPYDRILVSASARRLPDALVGQLSPEGGVLVVPVGAAMTRVVREGYERTVTRHGVYNFVPLQES
ncbi:protein-L-isoaspartate O-methyltransferase [Aeromicrobium phragmitis]|uniref:Protein-L-isoaspartate O-methyltransferase n=1 Tax=Aeromicrobium phragmitis TaxID=2478914 RepID=A0A3L8PHZ8_9ACTN|nr:protein-L-isoaspartate O-methyltransferase [Aeromicrobium phragmitis]RLV54690.1 protein-L-isoaspartate O-methyltransferase [Aeromicrobium phragmitis]